MPRPTPIGTLVGLVAILLCLGGIALAAVLTNTLRLGGSTPTPRPTAVSQAATATGSSQAPMATHASLPGGAPTADALTAVAQTTATVPAPGTVPTQAGELTLTPGGTVLGVPTAASGAPGTPGSGAATVAPAGTAVAPAGGTLSAEERQYITAFNNQIVNWNNGLIAFNVEMQSVNPKDPGWLQNMQTTSGQMRSIAQTALQLQAPPRLAAIDAEYKAAARHFDQAMQLITEWLGGNESVVHDFNVEMREGSAALQTAINQVKAFTTTEGAGAPGGSTAPAPGPGVPSNKP